MELDRQRKTVLNIEFQNLNGSNFEYPVSIFAFQSFFSPINGQLAIDNLQSRGLCHEAKDTCSCSG
jgi:hypothetical protein